MAQRVLVTAGASGIGRAIAEKFIADGADVAICDVDQTGLAEMAAIHPALIVQHADVTSESDMKSFLQALEDQWHGVDVVCANAGTGGPAGRIETLDYAEWQDCVATNLHGSFLTYRWAARLMRAQGSGLICLTSSTAGQMGYPLRSPYAAAKWAIVGLTKTLAMELGDAGVRVNAICPGAVEGNRMDRVIANEAVARGQDEDAVRQSYVKGVSMKTWVTAQDIANTIAFIASPAGSKISGQILAVDGHTETLAP
ncbi:SDR family oxidoreductase [Gammaproteobacteria bacterium]|nr:SDR family oxidoreductase [Gammaproteobacteria bacterium]